MLEVKVSVSVEGMKELANAILALAGSKGVKFEMPEPVAEEAVEAPKRGRRKTVKAEEKVEEAPVIEEQAETAVEETPEEEQPAISDLDPGKGGNAATLYALSEAGSSLLEAGKMEALIALLHSFNVEAVTMLKPEQYEDFAKGLRRLGAKI